MSGRLAECWGWSKRRSPLVRSFRFVLRMPSEADMLVDGAELPKDCAEMVRLVVRRTRLWPGEKADVARELIDHVRDARAAEREPAEIVSSFGDAKTAARLIRRARKRQRHPLQRGWVAFVRAVLATPVVAAAVYGVLWLRFHIGEPTIATNYIAQLEAERPDAGPGTPPYVTYELTSIRWNDIAEPIDKYYNDAVLDDDRFELFPALELWSLSEDHPAYEDIAEAIRAFGPELEKVVAAAARPAHGMPFVQAIEYPGGHFWESTIPAEQRRFRIVPVPDDPAEQGPLWAVLLPHLGIMRRCGMLLLFDARIAARDGDADRVCNRISAVLGMADQAAADQFPISMLVSQALVGFAGEAIARMVRDHPELLSTPQLTAISHLLAASTQRATALDFSRERMMIEDVLQRSFTDNGRGGGRLTDEAVRWIRELGIDDFGAVPDFDAITRVKAFLLPVAAVVVADRATQREIAMRQIDRAEASFLAGPSSLAAMEREKREDDDLLESEFARWRYLVLAHFGGSYQKVVRRAFESRTTTHGTLIAAAALLYEREHSRPPVSLDDLIPRYLPSAPEDPFLPGSPLRMARHDGQLTVY
ncbi:MAG: hypothetical protein ACTS22_02005, partial [Phycisphaerales bacterium]